MPKKKKEFEEKLSRSLIKTITYRLFIVILDFSVVYLITRKISLATFFVIISNIYTTIAYFIHERIWNKIKLGKKIHLDFLSH